MNADSAVLFANISCYGSRVRQGFLHAILKTNGVESVSVTGRGGANCQILEFQDKSKPVSLR